MEFPGDFVEKRMRRVDRRQEARRDHDPLPVEAETWQEACGLLTKSVQAVQQGYLDFARRVILILCLIGFLLVGMLAVEGILILDTSHQTSDIQKSRIAACNATNDRNTATIAALKASQQQALTPKKLLSTQQTLATLGIHATIAQVARFQQLSSTQSQGTIDLINALVPFHSDCKAFVTSG